MVNAYMYQPGTSGGQGPQQGPAVPTTTPAYSSYQPTPTQGYQASGAAQPAANWDKGWEVLWGWAMYPNSAMGSLSRREDGLVGSRSPDLLLLLW